MTKILVKGDVYTVATKTECSVTSANGTPLGKATAGNPLSFTATTDSVELSDPDAEFARVNPKCAPVKLRLLGLLGGGVQTLPAGYIAAEFLKSSRTQRIEIPDIVIDYQDVVTFRQSQASGKPTAGVYSTLKRGDIFRLFAGGTGVHLQFFSQNISMQNYYESAKIIKADKAGVEVDSEFLPFSSQVTSGSDTGFCLFTEKINGSYYNTEMAVHWFDISNKLKLRPALDTQGVPCMYDSVSTQSFRNSGTGEFIVGMTLPQARNLRKLPATGGNLTVSLPWEAQLIASGVPDALQAAADKGWTITVQYREPEADSAVYNKYANCKTLLEMFDVDPNWQTDITSDLKWVYPLTSMLESGAKYQEMKNNFCPVKATDYDLYLPNATSFSWSFFNNKSIKKAKLYAPKVENIDAMFRWCANLEEVTGYAPNIKSLYLVVSDVKLKKWTIELPKLQNDGESGFSSCILDKESTLIILGSIPTYTSGTHKLRMGIHVDHQTDEDVIEAITNAEIKGWTLEVRWNGTASTQTASTFGLRSPAIYAKVGSMMLPDGTTEQHLDWGHYVTNAEENGYQEFASVEEAKEYFNINQTEA